MIQSYLLSDLDIDSILNLPEVLYNETQINEKENGTVSFTINTTENIKYVLYERMGLDLSNINTIPMRWIKGDSLSHVDTSINSFNKTHLIYLTNSPGNLIINNELFPISKGNGYVFSEGLQHETVGTDNVPRLLIGPMSEDGISVGGILTPPTTLSYEGDTTVYLKQDGSYIVYSTDPLSFFDILYFPVTVINTNTSLGVLKIEFEDIILSSINDYFICGSSYIQFGSNSLKNNGTRPVITIYFHNYPGLIQNGNYEFSLPSYSNIYVYNLIVDASGYTLAEYNGWIGQQFFGYGGSVDNYIVNCSSSGNIVYFSGGIVGSNSSSQSGYLYIYGCSSSGDIGEYSGGICGAGSGSSNGNVECHECWSSGFIGNRSGGISGYGSGYFGKFFKADKCYSTGYIFGDNAGGIFGEDVGNACKYIVAINCYSTGDINTTAGGIFGGFAGSDFPGDYVTSAVNCYSLGTLTAPGSGIYGNLKRSGTETNCYSANGSWSTISANSLLAGVPLNDEIIGTNWV